MRDSPLGPPPFGAELIQFRDFSNCPRPGLEKTRWPLKGQEFAHAPQEPKPEITPPEMPGNEVQAPRPALVWGRNNRATGPLKSAKGRARQGRMAAQGAGVLPTPG